jgi:hypothetical protein
MYIPTNYTLHVEIRDDGKKGIWLCLDDGVSSIPIARFVSEKAAEQYKQAVNLSFAKAHQMGRMGI